MAEVHLLAISFLS